MIERRLAAESRLTDPLSERQRRVVVSWTIALFLMMLVEGPIRKWGPSFLATPVYFLRDPFVLALYFYGAARGMFPRTALTNTWLTFAAFASVLTIPAFMANGYGIVEYVLGIRSYWLYVPLCFLVAATFTRADIGKLLRWMLIASVISVPLVFTQYNSPPDSWINFGLAGDSSSAIGVAVGIVRPFGLFTFTAQNVDFTAAAVAAFIGFLLVRRWGKRGWLLVLIGAVAIGIMSILTGSRSIFFLIGAIVLVTTIGGMISAPAGIFVRYLVLLAVTTSLTAYLLFSQFGDMSTAMASRMEDASEQEGGLLNRLLNSFFATGNTFEDSPLWGHGLGVGTNGVSAYLQVGGLRLGEDELQRVLNELGPLLGLIFLTIRFVTAAVLVRQSIASAAKGWPSSLPLAGYAFLAIAIGQITNSTQNAFLPWLFAGLVLADDSKYHWRGRRASGRARTARMMQTISFPGSDSPR